MNKTKLSKVYDYHCEECKKGYSSYQSYWNHNKKFHNTLSLKKSDNGLTKTENSLIETDKIFVEANQFYNNKKEENIKEYICRYCSKNYNNKNSRWSHEQKCKIIIKKENNEEIEIKKIEAENKNKELQLQILKEEKQILKLKLKLEKSDDNVTVKQLNKKLLKHNNLIKNSNLNSNNNSYNNNKIQNNIVNNNVFQITGFSKEDICDVLTINEKKQIMNAKLDCINKLVEIVNCNVDKYHHYKNIIITNINNNYMYKYDDDSGQFKLAPKLTALNSLIDNRIGDIETIYQQLVDMNKIDSKTKHLVEKFIDKINNDDSKFIDIDGIQYENFRNYKINEIKMLLYNNQDIITNGISSMLTNDDNEPTVEIKL